jgi:hypothetical protein
VKRIWLVLGAIIALTAPARAQDDPVRAAQEDGCEPTSTLAFAAGTARLDLTAQSDLSVAANWTWAEPGRSLMVAGPTGPLPGDARLGYIRSMEAIKYLADIGVDPHLIALGNYDDSLTPSEATAVGDIDTVVILSCVPVPRTLLPEAVLPPS